jgi:hypothetical protein
MSYQRFDLGKNFLSLMLCFIWMGCASKPFTNNPSKVPGVLGEVNQGGEQSQSSESKAGSSENLLLANINEKLKSLGYEALGLQFESDETLLLLGKVFDSPVSHNRQIRIVYTGLEMSYDIGHQSLTIGGRKDLKSILNYIQKNIPSRSSMEPVKGVTSEVKTPTSPKGPIQPKKAKLKKTTVKTNKKSLRNSAKKIAPPSTTVPPAVVPQSTLNPSPATSTTTTESPVVEPPVTESLESEPSTTVPKDTDSTPPDEAVSPESAEPESSPSTEPPKEEVFKPTPL